MLTPGLTDQLADLLLHAVKVMRMEDEVFEANGRALIKY